MTAMDLFAKLPEGCIAEIVSFTSPADASALSVISKRFKSATESDSVWKKFLPPDIDEIVSKSSIPSYLAPTKKDLYALLSHSHILLDGGKLGFFLEKSTGKKCFIVAPSELVFTEKIYSNGQIMVQELIFARSSDVAVLNLMAGRMFNILGRITPQKLSEETHYSSYLVYKLSPKRSYFNVSFTGCRFVDNEGRVVRDRMNSYVRIPVSREDGWFEVEIGTFFNAEGNRSDVESCVFNLCLQFGQSLIVRGIEFRPETIFGDMSDCGIFKEFLEEKLNF
ncbi:unnamed protein product [Cuscuta epithymum]|uniref:F-box domain-containing protein n=1 Tax=Cuscuta epithymum TaxID=186058 RepID=A0AAV0F2P1_9ASTE|nr:unnamed protein product [Cuscuta epithymum]